MDEKLRKITEEVIARHEKEQNRYLDNLKRQEEKMLRDDFAGRAMQGILSAQTKMRNNGYCNTVEGIKHLAEESYLIADAMLRERKEVYGE